MKYSFSQLKKLRKRCQYFQHMQIQHQLAMIAVLFIAQSFINIKQGISFSLKVTGHI